MTNKLFAKFDLGFVDNPKIIGLSDAAFRAYVESIVYARQHLTDGFVDARVISRKWGQGVLDELTTNDVTNPSWKSCEGGIQIHDFDIHQTTKAEIQEIRKARSEAGKRGAEAKAKQNVSKSSAKENILLSKTKPETETETETYNLSSKVERLLENMFDSFWHEYPRKVGKESARKAFMKAAKDTSVDDIVAGAVRLGQDPNLPDPQYIPYPATWLNRGGWDDEPYPASLKVTDKFIKPSLPQPPTKAELLARECRIHSGYPLPCDRCREES
jgi:hypothetical protein